MKKISLIFVVFYFISGIFPLITLMYILLSHYHELDTSYLLIPISLFFIPLFNIGFGIFLMIIQIHLKKMKKIYYSIFRFIIILNIIILILYIWIISVLISNI